MKIFLRMMLLTILLRGGWCMQAHAEVSSSLQSGTVASFQIAANGSGLVVAQMPMPSPSPSQTPTPAKKKPPGKKPTAKKQKPIVLPPVKLKICQYGFAFVGFKKPVQHLKVKGNSNPKAVKKAGIHPNGKVAILAAGKDYGNSTVTITGEFVDASGNITPFTQTIKVSVVMCPKKSKPGPKPKPGPPGGNVGPPVTKTICPGESYYYTLHITAPDGSNTLIHVSAVSNAPGVASTSYDPASQTVSGVGINPGTATITVTGEVEAVEEDIPFSQTITVNVLTCLSVEICKGATAFVAMDKASGATSNNPGVATAAVAPKGVNVTGVNVGSAIISVTDADNKPVGRITAKVKKCPAPALHLMIPPPGVILQFFGVDVNRVRVVVENKTGEEETFAIPAGMIFIPNDPAYQKMMSVHTVRLSVAPNSTEQVEARAMCLEMKKKEPNLLVTFNEKESSDPVLQKLADLTDRAGFAGPHDQARIWIYTDHADLATMNKRILPPMTAGEYLDALYEVSQKAGVNLSTPDYRNLLDPHLLADSSSSSESTVWLVGTLSKLDPTGLSQYLQTSVKSFAENLRRQHTPGDLQHAALLASSLCQTQNHDTRLSGLTFLLQAIPEEAQQAKEIQRSLSSAQDLLKSENNDEVEKAIQVMSTYAYKPSESSLQDLETNGKTERIKSLAHAALEAMTSK